MNLVLLVNFPAVNGTDPNEFAHGASQAAAVIDQSVTLRPAQPHEGGNLYRVGSSVTGIKTVQPFGEIGLQMEPLLPLQLGPAGIKDFGEFGIDLQEIALVAGVVIKFIDQRTGISEKIRPIPMRYLKLDFHRRGGQTPEGILEPFTPGFSGLSSDSPEKTLGRKLHIAVR